MIVALLDCVVLVDAFVDRDTDGVSVQLDVVVLVRLDDTDAVSDPEADRELDCDTVGTNVGDTVGLTVSVAVSVALDVIVRDED